MEDTAAGIYYLSLPMIANRDVSSRVFIHDIGVAAAAAAEAAAAAAAAATAAAGGSGAGAAMGAGLGAGAAMGAGLGAGMAAEAARRASRNFFCNTAFATVPSSKMPAYKAKSFMLVASCRIIMVHDSAQNKVTRVYNVLEAAGLSVLCRYI